MTFKTIVKSHDYLEISINFTLIIEPFPYVLHTIRFHVLLFLITSNINILDTPNSVEPFLSLIATHALHVIIADIIKCLKII